MDSLVHFLEENIGIPIAMSFALISAMFSLVGIGLAASNKVLAERLGDYLGLLAGVLLGFVALTHLLPEAFEVGRLAIIFIIVGFGVGWILDNIAHVDHDKVIGLTMTPIIAIGLHSFLDGMVYVASFDHSHMGGGWAGVGLILHELPEGLLVFVLSFKYLRGLLPALGVSIFAASLSTPLGAWCALLLDQQWGEMFLLYAFPVSAGLVSWASFILIRGHIHVFGKAKI